MGQTLKALDVIVQRYKDRSCVTGISVCNEPSNEIPERALCTYYERAIDRVRKAGMSSERVAIVLPLFQRAVEPFLHYWQNLTHGRYENENICFDVHCYHCFENEFNGKSFAEHLRFCGENAAMLRQYPMVVGEWSLALGCATWTTCGKMAVKKVQQLFCRTQLDAFKEASHGYFFWNWTDRDDAEWNFQTAYAQGCFKDPKRSLPEREGSGEDPLEAELNPSPRDPDVHFGDTVYLRVFHGRYLDAEGAHVQARWADKSLWQEVTIFRTSADPSTKSAERLAKRVAHGDKVRLQAHNGRFLAVNGDSVSSLRPKDIRNPSSAEYEVCLENGEFLRHRGRICFQSRHTGLLLDADADDEAISARYGDLGEWQTFVVEKKPQQGKKRTAEPAWDVSKAKALKQKQACPRKKKRA
jgi:hypothetical protein